MELFLLLSFYFETVNVYFLFFLLKIELPIPENPANTRERQNAEPKLYHWAIDSHRTQAMPN